MNRWFGLLATSAEQGRWALADQILSSATNFGVAIVLARFLGPAEFGVFALAFVTWVGAMSIARALLAQPYVIKVVSLVGAEWRRETRLASGGVLAFGLLMGAAAAGVGLGLGVNRSLGRTLLALGAFLPCLLLQDFWRLAGFSCNRARSVFGNDAVWGLVEIVLLAVLWSTGKLSAPMATLAWGTGALAGTLLGLGQFRSSPSIGRRTLLWIRANLPIGGWFGLESAMYTVGSQAAIIMLAATLGPAAIGGIRAASNLFGPVQLLSIAGESVALPSAARLGTLHGPPEVRKFTLQYIVVLGIIVATYAATLVVFGQMLLEVVFGRSFARFAPVVLPLALSHVAGVWGSGAATGLRALGAGRELVVAQAVGTSAKLVLVALLVSPFGLLGGAWALSIGAATHSSALWLKLLGGTRDQPARGSDGSASDSLSRNRGTIER